MRRVERVRSWRLARFLLPLNGARFMSFHMGGSVLVTGGAGFIGRHLVGALRADGRDVRVIDDLCVPPLLDPPPELIRKCVAEMEPQDLDGVECIVHLAAWRNVPDSFCYPLRYLDNIHSAAHLLDIARRSGTPRVIVGSTCEVYGSAEQLPTPEGACMAPQSPYAMSKAAVEFVAGIHAVGGDGPEISIARLFNVYGPGNRPDTVAASFCRSAICDGVVRVEGDGEQRRDFSPVSRTVAQLTGLVDHHDPPSVVNLGSGSSRSVNEIADVVCSLFPGTRVEYLPARPREIVEFRADTTLADAALRLPAPPSFEDGIRETSLWWKSYLRRL